MTDGWSLDRVNNLRRQDGPVHGGDRLLPRHPAGQEKEEGNEQGQTYSLTDLATFLMN